MQGKRMQWITDGAFRYKLIAASIACLLIPTLITLIVSNALTRETVRQQVSSSAEDQLQLINSNLSNVFRYMLYISNYILVDPEMNTILKEQAAGKQYSGENAEYREFADRYTVTNKIDNISMIGEKAYVTILLPNGRYFTNYPVEEYDPKLLFQQEWFKQLEHLKGSELYWVKTHPSPYLFERTKQRSQLSVARTLRSANMRIYAYVVVTVTENYIHRMFEQTNAEVEVMLVDEQHSIISHIDQQRLGERLDYLEHIGAESTIIQLAQKDVLVTQTNTEVAGWRLVSLIPYETAIGEINRNFKTVFLLQVIVFIIFLLLLIGLIRTFTRPLVRLGRVARIVERGNLEVRSNIRGRDEIGRLGNSIDQMLDRIKQMITEITAEQMRKRKAELAMLQAQINPHFLFNVLNSIRMKVLYKGDKESAEMLSSLSRLLRMTIDRKDEMITLHEEIVTILDYMKLMNMRQKEKVELKLEVSSEAMMARVPRFLLQPVIENAMIHGLQQRAGTITLIANVEHHFVKIFIQDNGHGIDEDSLSALRSRLAQAEPPSEEDKGKGLSSLGLANVYERLSILFAEQFEFRIDSSAAEGTTVTMLIPYREDEA